MNKMYFPHRLVDHDAVFCFSLLVTTDFISKYLFTNTYTIPFNEAYTTPFNETSYTTPCNETSYTTPYNETSYTIPLPCIYHVM